MNPEQIKTLAESYNPDASQREEMLAEYCLKLVERNKELEDALTLQGITLRNCFKAYESLKEKK